MINKYRVNMLGAMIGLSALSINAIQVNDRNVSAISIAAFSVAPCLGSVGLEDVANLAGLVAGVTYCAGGNDYGLAAGKVALVAGGAFVVTAVCTLTGCVRGISYAFDQQMSHNEKCEKMDATIAATSGINTIALFCHDVAKVAFTLAIIKCAVSVLRTPFQ